MAGELITSFRPEIQMKILSNQDKYNPDKNEFIDEKEIGVLLKEFGATQTADLQKPKTVGEKLGGYLMPTSDVYPVESGGYRVKYTDGDEDFYKSKAEYRGRNNMYVNSFPNGREFIRGVTWLGAVSTGIVTAAKILDKFVLKECPHSGKAAVFAGIATLALAYINRRCDNSLENDKNNITKMEMIDTDKSYQAEKQKREEAQRRADLEYVERLHTATNGIEQNLAGTEQKTKRINQRLNQININAAKILEQMPEKAE